MNDVTGDKGWIAAEGIQPKCAIVECTIEHAFSGGALKSWQLSEKEHDVDDE